MKKFNNMNPNIIKLIDLHIDLMTNNPKLSYIDQSNRYTPNAVIVNNKISLYKMKISDEYKDVEQCITKQNSYVIADKDTTLENLKNEYCTVNSKHYQGNSYNSKITINKFMKIHLDDISKYIKLEYVRDLNQRFIVNFNDVFKRNSKNNRYTLYNYAISQEKLLLQRNDFCKFKNIMDNVWALIMNIIIHNEKIDMQDMQYDEVSVNSLDLELFNNFIEEQIHELHMVNLKLNPAKNILKIMKES